MVTSISTLQNRSRRNSSKSKDKIQKSKVAAHSFQESKELNYCSWHVLYRRRLHTIVMILMGDGGGLADVRDFSCLPGSPGGMIAAAAQAGWFFRESATDGVWSWLASLNLEAFVRRQ